jgi:hypothetical protein
LRCFYHWRVTGCFHRWPALLSTGGERAPLMAIACPVSSLFSLDERQRIKQWHFIVLRSPILGSSPLFPLLFPHPACPLPHAHRNPQPTGQIAVCRSTGKRWGCSVSTIGVSLMLSTDAPPCSPPGGACGVACSVFPSFPLDERHGIETRADPLAQAVFDIGWGRGYTLDMNVREIQAETLLWLRTH